MRKTLGEIVEEQPYPDFADWWPMGETFLGFMAEAIVPQWRALHQNPTSLDTVAGHVAEYVTTVYGREPRPHLVEDFVTGRNLGAMRSGEFDALSYAFYRSAYEWLESHAEVTDVAEERDKRRFAEQVGTVFYSQLHDHLALDLPTALSSPADLARLQAALGRVGAFLLEQGYLRDHFAFRFDVHTSQGGRQIDQGEEDFIPRLQQTGLAHALYEMGYPAILPSAVYLYHTLGEAQHHSSRTIQELFGHIGCVAAETEDFDPTGYPSNLVVELWEIRTRPL